MSLLSHNILNQCPAPGGLHFQGTGHLTQVSTALLLLFSGALKSRSASAFPTNISAAPSSTWYFSLSPFESILLGLIVLKLMILRYMNFLPIDVNKLVSPAAQMMGMGRRKRSTDPKVILEKERLAETMFTVLRRLDMQDCFLRTLCELQIHSLHGHPLTSETKLTLSALSKSGWKRRQKRNPNPDELEERPVLSVFEEAVQVGWDAKGQNGTECQERYFICPLSKGDILNHFDTIKVINVL